MYHILSTRKLCLKLARKERLIDGKIKRLSCYARFDSEKMADQLSISLQSYNNKELGKTPFNDKERLLIKSMVTKIKPDITIDELFYS